ncbi:MAG: DegT/DnrJ/EryC1/StrS family aminotransferase [Crocinitomicaceae bacterium]|nr:DegT/DnrJ/EryC1/StrS family aminotransferase [Crocinitomicaceae bacterium]
MKKIQMVDLQSQYQKIKSEIDSAIIDVIEKANFINGPEVGEFKSDLEKYLNVKHVIPCANGTDALQIALMALDLKPGDEIITPSFTYIATTEVIALLHLVPIFVDVLPDTYCIDPSKIEEAITSKTKAIVPVHLYGQCADMDAILDIAKKYNLAVIEDTAQAIGADYTHKDGRVSKAGTMGDIGCTSFFPSKNLGCYGDGGAMYTNDAHLAANLKKIANHGQVIKYHHEIVGCNSRLDTIQAAILKIKLKDLDNYCSTRQEVAAYYDNAFAAIPQITIPVRQSNSTHVFHQYTVKLNSIDREAMVNYLSEHGIPSMIYYPLPAHKQGMFKSFGKEDQDLPITNLLTTQVLSFPIHTEMEQEQLEYITKHIIHFIQTNA